MIEQQSPSLIEVYKDKECGDFNILIGDSSTTQYYYIGSGSNYSCVSLDLYYIDPTEISIPSEQYDPNVETKSNLIKGFNLITNKTEIMEVVSWALNWQDMEEENMQDAVARCILSLTNYLLELINNE